MNFQTTLFGGQTDILVTQFDNIYAASANGATGYPFSWLLCCNFTVSCSVPTNNVRVFLANSVAAVARDTVEIVNQVLQWYISPSITVPYWVAVPVVSMQLRASYGGVIGDSCVIRGNWKFSPQG